MWVWMTGLTNRSCLKPSIGEHWMITLIHPQTTVFFVTPVSIHQWLWRCAVLFFKVIPQITRSHMTKNFTQFDPNWAVPDSNSSLNSPVALKWYTKLEVAYKGCCIVFQGHLPNLRLHRTKNRQFWFKFSISRLYLLFEFTNGFAWCMETLSALLTLCEGNPPVTNGLALQGDSNMELWCFLNC